MPDASPLIITLTLDDNTSSFFNVLRQRCFPPERNFLSAHLTLFHHLPANEPKIKSDLERWSRETAPLILSVTEVKSIGKGVAYKIACPDLPRLHRVMQQEWLPWLKPQDKQRLWPHVTVQNKVTPAEAKQTLAELKAGFAPFVATGTGFALWSYEGGPWKFMEGFSFGSH